MRKILLFGLLAAASVFSAPVLTVIPTLGPDVFTAPGSSFDDWAANVIANLRDPAAADGVGVANYTPLAPGDVDGSQFIATPFDSWKGVAPGPFAGQQGTALYFSLKIIAGAGETFALNTLAAQETYLGQAQLPYVPGDFSAFTPRLVGVKSGGGDTVGADPSTTLLTELYYVGLGFVQPLDPAAVGSNQDKIDATAAQIFQIADRTTQVSYTIDYNTAAGGTASATALGAVAVSGIPEPGTWALIGVGLAGLGILRRRSA